MKVGSQSVDHAKCVIESILKKSYLIEWLNLNLSKHYFSHTIFELLRG